MEAVRVMISLVTREEPGQDLVEYALLAAFIAVASAGAVTAAGISIRDMWQSINQALISLGLF